MQVLRRVFEKGQARKLPIALFCYHKGGTVLLSKVFRQLSELKRWKFERLLGQQTRFPDADVALFGHSLVDLQAVSRSFIGVHVVRDPRDIIVSGYLYHRRTSEAWCINTDFDLQAPIMFPRVPYSQEHRSEAWKRNYLESLGGKSYQTNLLERSQPEGLRFEMEHYGAWTIESIQSWNYDYDNILEVKFEDLMSNYDATFRSIFEHLDFSDSDLEHAMRIAAQHDLGRKSPEEIGVMKHVSSVKTSKWKKYFDETSKQAFVDKFGDVLVDLGYEEDNNW